MPSPLFMVTEGGVVSCLEAKSGNEVWKERLEGDYWASPLYAHGNIYFFSREGNVSVISAGREFEILAENEFGNGFIASPAIAGNTIIVRSLTHLYCFAQGYEMDPQPETINKPQVSKRKKSESKQASELPLNITGYYMGETNDDGEFEAVFLIEFPDLDKDDWPTVTFTGEQFRAAFANLTLYQRATFNLAEGAKVRKDGDK